MKNLNEEIKRIRSLFTEDRLFGNLVNEATNPDTSGDGKIDSSEFTASGDEIDTDEAMEFLIASGYTVTKPNVDDEKITTLDICSKKTNMKYIYGYSKSKNLLNKSGVRNNFNASNGVCYYYWTDVNAPTDGSLKVKKVVAWDDDQITFYIQLPYEIDLNSDNAALKSFDSFTAKMQLFVDTAEAFPGSISKTPRYIKFSGKLDYTLMKITDVRFLNFRDKDMKKTSFKSTLFEQIESEGYNPLVDQSGPATGTRMFGSNLKLTDMIIEVTGAASNFTIDKLIDKL
jgi:hypothetical protein